MGQNDYYPNLNTKCKQVQHSIQKICMIFVCECVALYEFRMQVSKIILTHSHEVSSYTREIDERHNNFSIRWKKLLWHHTRSKSIEWNVKCFESMISLNWEKKNMNKTTTTTTNDVSIWIEYNRIESCWIHTKRRYVVNESHITMRRINHTHTHTHRDR